MFSQIDITFYGYTCVVDSNSFLFEDIAKNCFIKIPKYGEIYLCTQFMKVIAHFVMVTFFCYLY